MPLGSSALGLCNRRTIWHTTPSPHLNGSNKPNMNVCEGPDQNWFQLRCCSMTWIAVHSGKLSDMMTKLQQSSEEETGTIPPQQCSRLIRSDRKHFISVIAAMTDHTGTQLARIDNTHLQLQPGASFFIQHFLILKFILIVLWVKRSTKGEFKWTLIQHSEVILQHISS